jgi:hypothetical protein
MGEYATRKSDGVEVKIGTCESMYYLRHEDQSKVTYQHFEHGLRYRLPFPDEDSVAVGGYRDHDRGLRLYKTDENGLPDDFIPEGDHEPGTIQLTHPSGLLVNVKCHHGLKLPEGSDDIQPHWNGKSWFFELKAIKAVEGGTRPVYGCRHCRRMWSTNWDSVIDYTNVLKDRLTERYL